MAIVRRKKIGELWCQLDDGLSDVSCCFVPAVCWLPFFLRLDCLSVRTSLMPQLSRSEHTVSVGFLRNIPVLTRKKEEHKKNLTKEDDEG